MKSKNISYLLWILCNLSYAHGYGSISGGYGNFNHVLSNDGITPSLRAVLGAAFHVTAPFSLGTELGIQTGNRMRIDTSNAIAAFGAAPVFLTIKPIGDFLGTLTYDLDICSLFFQAKGGGAYEMGMFDSLTVPNKSAIRPELQAGFGYYLSYNVSIIAYYQRIFGGMPTLTDIDFDAGTGRLNQLPIWQGGFLGVQMTF